MAAKALSSISKDKSPLASEILSDAMKHCSKSLGRDISYKELAKKLDINPSSMWFPLHNKRSWVADRWLFTLKALGRLTFEGDNIIINVSKLSKFKPAFNQIGALTEDEE